MNDLVYLALPVAFITAALLWFRHLRGLVGERFQKAAARRRGRVVAAPWILYPRLVVELDRAEIQISSLHGSGNGRATRTFAWVGCREYPDLELRVRRWPGRVGTLERLGWKRCATGDRPFDEVFWVQGASSHAVGDLLEADLRRALLAFEAPLAVTLSVGTGNAYRNGWQVIGEHEPHLDVSIRALPPEVDDVERLIDAATLMHARLRRPPLRMSA